MRQTHHSASPWHLARSVPANTIKSICDVWNGYHTVPIREEDRKYTQFITPWGRFRYCRAPQGAHWSGDAFTQRYDEVTKDVKKVAKCVDDTVLWADSIKEAFDQVCSYLTLVGRNGIVMNPAKFVFAEKTVEFAGFTITPDSVKPSPTYLEGIKNFPPPRDITGARSFFGLVNQASYAFSMKECMQPFRHLLKKGVKFEWNPELQRSFDEAKQHIIDLVEEGVKIFDMSKPTCLATDWCRQGVGFFLMQKHCGCKVSPVTPTCCTGGWKLVFAGGRFTTPCESKYSPVEGEALAIVVALYKTRYFVLGCENLVVATDHKPLLKVFGDRQLEEMDNPRLTNLKEKASYFSFDMVHVPGRFHKGPDAMSRVSKEEQEEAELASIMAGVSTKELRLEILKATWTKDSLNCSISEDKGARDCLEEELKYLHGDIQAQVSMMENKNNTAVTWERIAAATEKDHELGAIREVVESGGYRDVLEAKAQFQDYKLIMEKLSALEGVLLYKGRAVIPPSLRTEVLSILHSAHQGVSSMHRRAESCVYWPGITEDIRRVRLRCESCNRFAPSQPAPPPTPLPQPQYPFELIAADFCTFKGYTYLVCVDRYSGWLSVYQCEGGGTANQLIDMLRTHFCTFGVSRELASDQGSQFMAGETKQFLDSWGCSQRLSSAYYAHSNCRAELGIKTAKRMLRENTSQDGSFSNKFYQAILTHRNTPDPDTGASPAQVLFGRQIRDFLPIKPRQFDRGQWREIMADREKGLKMRYTRGLERWSEHTKELPKLKIGDVVLIQNQRGTPKEAKRWDRSGVVLEVDKFDKYVVKVDGTGRITTRNRRFLKKAEPYQPRQPGPGSETVKAPVQEPLRAALAKELQQDGGERKEDTEPLAYDESLVDDMVEDPRVSDHFENDEAIAQEAEGRLDSQESEPLRRSGRVRRKNTMYDEGTWCMDQE